MFDTCLSINGKAFNLCKKQNCFIKIFRNVCGGENNRSAKRKKKALRHRDRRLRFLLQYQRTDCIADDAVDEVQTILNEEQLKFIDKKMKANNELTSLDLKI